MLRMQIPAAVIQRKSCSACSPCSTRRQTGPVCESAHGRQIRGRSPSSGSRASHATMRTGGRSPDASPEVVSERACTAVVDGGGAMGQVGATFATRLAMEKARRSGVATVVLRNTSHIGRVGAYPLLIAREGMIGQIFVNAGRLGYQIAPFGGIDGRLSTNPIAFAAPAPGRGSDPRGYDDVNRRRRQDPAGDQPGRQGAGRMAHRREGGAHHRAE